MKTKSRTFVKNALRKILGDDFFIRNSEDFYNSLTDGIWTSGESYGKNDITAYGPEVKKMLNKANWFIQWYDPGTIMIYPL